MSATLSPAEVKRERFGLGTFALVLAVLAAATPIVWGPGALRPLGALLMIAGLLELLHCFRRVRQDVQRSGYASAGLTFFHGTPRPRRAGPGRYRVDVVAGRVVRDRCRATRRRAASPSGSPDLADDRPRHRRQPRDGRRPPRAVEE